MEIVNIIELDEIQEQLNKEIEKDISLLEPKIIKLSQELDQHILDYYKINKKSSINKH